MDLERKLSELGITLPAAATAVGAYVPAKRCGNLLLVSGQLPMKDGKLMAIGPVPGRCTVEQAKAAARQCAINALGMVKAYQGTLSNVVGVVRVGAFVASDNGFTQQPQIANGASEFLNEIFGEAGRHVRAAVGANVLPLDASVEIEFTFEVA